jgi:hypothetical protein
MIRITGTVYKVGSKDEAFSYPVGPDYHWVEFFTDRVVFRAETDRNGTYATELPEGVYEVRVVGQAHTSFVHLGNGLRVKSCPVVIGPMMPMVIDLADPKA